MSREPLPVGWQSLGSEKACGLIRTTRVPSWPSDANRLYPRWRSSGFNRFTLVETIDPNNANTSEDQSVGRLITITPLLPG